MQEKKLTGMYLMPETIEKLKVLTKLSGLNKGQVIDSLVKKAKKI